MQNKSYIKFVRSWQIKIYWAKEEYLNARADFISYSEVVYRLSFISFREITKKENLLLSSKLHNYLNSYKKYLELEEAFRIAKSKWYLNYE